MTFGIPGTETRSEALTRSRARIYGARYRETENENILNVLKHIKLDLRDACEQGAIPCYLRFSLLLRVDHLLIDVFGLEDDGIHTGHEDEYTEEVAAIKAHVEKVAAAYNWSNPVVAWDYRFSATVRLLSEREQWSLRNAQDLIDVQPYPY